MNPVKFTYIYKNLPGNLFYLCFMQRIKSGLIILCCLAFTKLHAQNIVPASAGNSSGSGGTVAYSIGQIVYSTYQESNGSVSQGVQQSYEISLITGIEEAKDITLEFLVYPNPATDFITLRIKNYETMDLNYKLYDINGTILGNSKIESNEITISMQNLKSSVYFLKLIHGPQDIKTFKVIKN